MNSPEQKHRTMIPAHRFSGEQVERLMRAISPDIEMLLTYRTQSLPEEYREIERRFPNLRVEFVDKEAIECNPSQHPEINLAQIYDLILQDPSTALIWERSIKSTKMAVVRTLVGRTESMLKAGGWMAIEIIKAIALFKRYRITFLVFSSTPHTIGSWVSAKTAEAMGIQIFIIERCAVPSFFRIKPGLSLYRGGLEASSGTDEEEVVYRSGCDSLIRRIQSSYNEAMPDNEKERLEVNSGRVFSLWNTLVRNWYAPGRVVNAMRCWRMLSQLSEGLSAGNNGKYVVFFLHYQPERTTVPDGGVFGYQVNAILLLRRALPDDIHLFVKEHPSTFSRSLCNPMARDPDYYRKLDSISGVSWLSIYSDNFDVLDDAVLVATITGTVALEACIRGIPAVTFGRPLLHGARWMMQYSKEGDLLSFLEDCLSDDLSKEQVSEDTIKAIGNEVSSAFHVKSDGEEEKKIAALEFLSSNEFLE